MTKNFIQSWIIWIMLFIRIAQLMGDSSQDQIRIRGRYSRSTDLADYELIVPQRITHTGQVIPSQTPHRLKRSDYISKNIESVPPEDRIHFLLPIKGKNYHVELHPNFASVSPGAVVETVSRGKPTTFQRLNDNQCHFKGRVRDDPSSSVVISTCYGLAGYIKTKHGLFVIEPIDKDSPDYDHLPHLVYESDLNKNTGLCDTADSLARIISSRLVRQKREGSASMGYNHDTSNQQLYIETLLVLDKPLIDFHAEMDVENYAITVFNMANNVFHDASIGQPINVVIVRIIRLDEEEHEMNQVSNADANATLEAFCLWQKKINPGDDSHPNHHDIAIFLTRIDICSSPGQCGLLGLSKLAGMCDPDMSCIIAEDNGLKVGFVIAHQLGHSLGMLHDSKDESGCDPVMTSAPKFNYVMAANISMRTGDWSSCSKDFLRMYLESDFGTCLEDEPADHDFPVNDFLPGVMYDGDYQCRSLTHVATASMCDTGVTCDSLNCFLEQFGCIETHISPADGTQCGEKKWCYESNCISVGERPGAVDGSWSDWGSWSDCSRTCGSGVSFSQRQCNNPPPSHGGKFCVGNTKKHKICSTEPCEMGQPSFRDVQCAEFNDWIYPEDGKTHLWKGFHMHDENPCTLICINDEKVVASLKPNVIDGTTCRHGNRDICIGGVCKEIPCDLDLESKSVEDSCGICHGDSLSCTIKEGVKFFEKSNETKLLYEVPLGTRNIKVEETKPTKSKIMVTSGDRKQTYVKGNILGLFNVPGSKAWLGMIRSEQEALNIPGPITDALKIMISVQENCTIKYSLGLPAKEKRIASFQWDYIDWSRCSAQCGPGTQMAIPKCTEKVGGLVEDSYCKDPRPNDKSRTCSNGPCIPRWMIGDWQPCIGELKRRSVKCVRPGGTGEGAVDIILDNKCQGKKPREQTICDEGKKTKRQTKLLDRSFIEDELDLVLNQVQGLRDDIFDDEDDLDFPPYNTSASDAKRKNADAGETECIPVKKTGSGVSTYPVEKRGKLIIDKDSEKDMKITVLLGTDENGTKIIPPGLPPIIDNASSITLTGHEAALLLEKIQGLGNFTNNP